jgi:hypothetical protein
MTHDHLFSAHYGHTGGAEMTPDENGNEIREMIWEMSRVTNKILILGILLILAILAVLKYRSILTN